jgi:hypothetical protein
MVAELYADNPELIRILSHPCIAPIDGDSDEPLISIGIITFKEEERMLLTESLLRNLQASFKERCHGRYEFRVMVISVKMNHI